MAYRTFKVEPQAIHEYSHVSSNFKQNWTWLSTDSISASLLNSEVCKKSKSTPPPWTFLWGSNWLGLRLCYTILMKVFDILFPDYHSFESTILLPFIASGGLWSLKLAGIQVSSIFWHRASISDYNNNRCVKIINEVLNRRLDKHI